MTDCPFCNPDDILLENDLAFAKYDLYPVSPGHVLVVPKRHTASWFDLTPAEQTAMFALMHVHLHIIPRYFGDVPNPRGGIRAVIAAKQDYTHRV